jgi:hypothetical protein
VPANTDSVPPEVSFRMSLLAEFAMYRFPLESTAISSGLLSSELVASPGVGAPDPPVPANTDSVPLGVTFRTSFRPPLAM